VARKLLASRWQVDVVAWVSTVQTIAADVDPNTVTRALVDATPVRCPVPAVAAQMIEAIEAARKAGNSLGGTVTCAVRGCPVGWGEPVFDRLEADLAKAMLSLPASKGFEIGSGFAGTALTGLEHNDEFYMDGDRVRTRTNRSGGVQGGITNGETVTSRVAFRAHGHRDARARDGLVRRRRHDDHGARPPRPCTAARGPDGRGDGGARARRPRAPAGRRPAPLATRRRTPRRAAG
jgi:chorismate synthase